jgi:hypothetical protein
MGPPHQRGVPDEGLDCLAGLHGSATSWIGGWLGANPACPKPRGGWARGCCCEGSGEVMAPRRVMPRGMGKQRVHIREQVRDPAFIESHRSPTPEREWSGSPPPMRQ